MYLSASVRSFALAVCLVPYLAFAAPSLQNVKIDPAGENNFSIVTASLNNGGGGNLAVRITWGDGTPLETYTYTNTASGITNWHIYDDDNPTVTPSDSYSVSISVSNNTGVFTTNMVAVVTNVPPNLVLTVDSPIEPGSAATLRGVEITEFPILTRGGFPFGMCLGPDGAVWFTETGASRIGRVTTNGIVTEFPVAGGPHDLQGIVTGPDNRLWFCAFSSEHIGAMTTNGVVTLYRIPRVAGEPLKLPQYITRGSGTNMWFTQLGYRLGRITPGGVITEVVYPAGVNPHGIVLGFENDIWFTDNFNGTVNRRRFADGMTLTYPMGVNSGAFLITRGPDGALWFTETGTPENDDGYIGRITTNGVATHGFVGKSRPYGITTGTDGAIWITERRSNTVARLTMDGVFYRFQLAPFSSPREIVNGADGALWVALAERDRIARVRYTTSGNVLLTGSLNDPGTFDPHTVQIDWGDGTPVQTLNLAAGIASFHVTHQYSGSQLSYLITVSATDDDSGASSKTATVVVNAIQLTSITRSGTEVRVKGKGATGRTITIQGSANLQDWSNLGTVTSTTNGFEFIHPGSPPTRQFYRGRL